MGFWAFLGTMTGWIRWLFKRSEPYERADWILEVLGVREWLYGLLGSVMMCVVGILVTFFRGAKPDDIILVAAGLFCLGIFATNQLVVFQDWRVARKALRKVNPTATPAIPFFNLRRLAKIGAVVAAAFLLVWLRSPKEGLRLPVLPAEPAIRTLPFQPPSHLLLDLFMTDGNTITGGMNRQVYFTLTADTKTVGTGFFRVNYDMGSGSKYIFVYVLRADDPKLALSSIITQIKRWLEWDLENGLAGTLEMHAQGESTLGFWSALPFTGSVFLYYENTIGPEDMGEITRIYRENNLRLVPRGYDYAFSTWQSIRLGSDKPPEFRIDGRYIIDPSRPLTNPPTPAHPGPIRFRSVDP